MVRIGLKGWTIPNNERPPSNLVFLIDVSGSMGTVNKLPLLKQSMKLLTNQLTENDTVSIAVYAGASEVWGGTGGGPGSGLVGPSWPLGWRRPRGFRTARR